MDMWTVDWLVASMDYLSVGTINENVVCELFQVVCGAPCPLFSKKKLYKQVERLETEKMNFSEQTVLEC